MKEKDFDIIESIKKCSFKEGDIVFIKCNVHVPTKRMDNIHKVISAVFPDNIRTLIIPKDFDVGVLTKE